MAHCQFCGNPAGAFRQQHRDCEYRHARALVLLQAAARSAAIGIFAGRELEAAMLEAKNNYAADAEMRSALERGWEQAVDHFLFDHLLEPDEESRLMAFLRSWSLEQTVLNGEGGYSKIVKSRVLRDVLAGEVPQRRPLADALPFNFQKGEQLVWVFAETECLEDRRRREYAGQTVPASVHIGRGLYYRTSAFQGTPTERTGRISLGRGILGVTTRHIYFSGARSFRIGHDRIVTYTPFTDGIGIVQESASAKPQIFLTGDGWFTYNLLTNIARL